MKLVVANVSTKYSRSKLNNELKLTMKLRKAEGRCRFSVGSLL